MIFKCHNHLLRQIKDIRYCGFFCSNLPLRTCLRYSGMPYEAPFPLHDQHIHQENAQASLVYDAFENDMCCLQTSSSDNIMLCDCVDELRDVCISLRNKTLTSCPCEGDILEVIPDKEYFRDLLSNMTMLDCDPDHDMLLDTYCLHRWIYLDNEWVHATLKHYHALQPKNHYDKNQRFLYRHNYFLCYPSVSRDILHGLEAFCFVTTASINGWCTDVNAIVSKLNVVTVKDQTFLSYKHQSFTFLSKPIHTSKRLVTTGVIKKCELFDVEPLPDLDRWNHFLQLRVEDRYGIEQCMKDYTPVQDIPFHSSDEGLLRHIEQFLKDPNQVELFDINTSYDWFQLRKFPFQESIFPEDEDQMHYIDGTYDANTCIVKYNRFYGSVLHLCEYQQNNTFKNVFVSFVRRLKDISHVWEIVRDNDQTVLISTDYLQPTFS